MDLLLADDFNFLNFRQLRSHGLCCLPDNNNLHTLAPGLYIVNGQKRQVNR